MFDAVSAGVPAGETIQFLNVSARLAIGGVTDLGTSTDGLTTILNAYKLETEETSKVADAFFSAQKEGKRFVALAPAEFHQLQVNTKFKIEQFHKQKYHVTWYLPIKLHN